MFLDILIVFDFLIIICCGGNEKYRLMLRNELNVMTKIIGCYILNVCVSPKFTC